MAICLYPNESASLSDYPVSEIHLGERSECNRSTASFNTSSSSRESHLTVSRTRNSQ